MASDEEAGNAVSVRWPTVETSRWKSKKASARGYEVTARHNSQERAKSLNRNTIMIDGLLSLHSVHYRGSADADFFAEYAKAGATAANITVTEMEDGPMEFLRRLPLWYRLLEERPDELILVRSCRDIEKAKAEGKFGVIVGTQNAAVFGSDLGLVSVFKQLGLGIVQLSYYGQNLIGEGCGERTDGGLSVLGIEVVKELNRVGVVIDLSHCGDQVRLDAIEYSSKPVIASHSNPRALNPSRRNLTDEQLMALASKGGVTGCVSFGALLHNRKGERGEVSDYLNMIDCVVKLVGPNHVGFGFDFTPWLPESEYLAWKAAYPMIGAPNGGLENKDFFQSGRDLGKVLEITQGLVERGYSDEDIAKIRGGNFMRVFREVWGE